MLLAAASAEPNRGWGGPLALLAAFVAFRVLMPVMQKLRDKIINPSPTPALPTAERVKVKATVGVTEPDNDDTEPEEGWWGRIVERNGHRYRVARQVMATGSHELPPDDEPDAAAEDPAIDLALDDDEPEEVEEERGETPEEFIARTGKNVTYGLLVNALMNRYGFSKSTAQRRIRIFKESQKTNR